MSKINMQIGFVGLGKMGSRMSLKLLTSGHDVVVWNRSEEPIQQLKSEIQSASWRTKQKIQPRSDRGQNTKHFNLKIGKLGIAKTIEELVKKLKSPRVLWLMLPAGIPTQEVLDEVIKYVKKDDIVIDGGNAYFMDTQKRFEVFAKHGVRYLGIGVSGGIIAVKKGYPLMSGGDKSAYQYITTILDSLAKPRGGHAYFGEGGAGHFVKMVHNGIEYGIMQSLGEGFGVLDKSPYSFDLEKVAGIWQKGTLVSGFMLDRTKDALRKDPKMEKIEGIIAESGEAGWTIEEAKKEDVDVPVIKASLEYRKRSQVEKKVQKSFAAKLIAAMRHEFGGHKVSHRS